MIVGISLHNKVGIIKTLVRKVWAEKRDTVFHGARELVSDIVGEPEFRVTTKGDVLEVRANVTARSEPKATSRFFVLGNRVF